MGNTSVVRLFSGVGSMYCRTYAKMMIDCVMQYSGLGKYLKSLKWCWLDFGVYRRLQPAKHDIVQWLEAFFLVDTASDCTGMELYPANTPTAAMIKDVVKKS